MPFFPFFLINKKKYVYTNDWTDTKKIVFWMLAEYGFHLMGKDLIENKKKKELRNEKNVMLCHV